MGERKFTFIELHLDGDTQFGPREIGEALPFGEKTEASDLETEVEFDEESDEAADDDSSGPGGKSAIGALVALAVLVGIAAAAKKFRGDDEPDLEDEEQPDVIVN
ncbi:hypothetical protein [Natrarchaeobius chitinivorans]|uniref:Uncharacterized protein n=1 Tax=Natrarchaeobius chitinivorans TaxID=1679083 RepID=A0A3N6PDP7_NATCH|nr:hypothetical protein [Natrarchaeobius chitinivorans]RQG97799.1 hypothetical protein EA473_00900 [Natrarchaeobius chitinivorans]